MINTDFEVGDQAELSPILLSRWLSGVLAAGYKVEISGDLATIVSGPETEVPVDDGGPEYVFEAPKVEVVEEPVVTVEEPPVKEIKSVGRPKKIVKES